MCVVLALVHSSLNPGMTDCRGRVSSFLPQPHAAHTSQSRAGRCVWRMCPLGSSPASTGKVIHIHRGFLQKGVQHLCISHNIFVAFSQPFRRLIGLLTSASSFGFVTKTFCLQWSCCCAVVMMWISTQVEADAHFEHKSLFLVLPTLQGTALCSGPLVTSTPRHSHGWAMLRMP